MMYDMTIKKLILYHDDQKGLHNGDTWKHIGQWKVMEFQHLGNRNRWWRIETPFDRNWFLHPLPPLIYGQHFGGSFGRSCFLGWCCNHFLVSICSAVWGVVFFWFWLWLSSFSAPWIFPLFRDSFWNVCWVCIYMILYTHAHEAMWIVKQIYKPNLISCN